MKTYRKLYFEDFGNIVKHEETIQTADIEIYMNNLAEKESYPTHEWEVITSSNEVKDDYGNRYLFIEETKENPFLCFCETCGATIYQNDNYSIIDDLYYCAECMKEEYYNKAEEMAEQAICNKGCLCPTLTECSQCEVFMALRDYYYEELTEKGE